MTSQAVHTLTAQHRSGAVQQVQIQTIPFYIGSGANAHLQLPGDGIQEMHIRLLTDDQQNLLLVNMGAAVVMDGQEIGAYMMQPFSPQSSVQIGDYELHISTQYIQHTPTPTTGYQTWTMPQPLQSTPAAAPPPMGQHPPQSPRMGDLPDETTYRPGELPQQNNGYIYANTMPEAIQTNKPLDGDRTQPKIAVPADPPQGTRKYVPEEPPPDGQATRIYTGAPPTGTTTLPAVHTISTPVPPPSPASPPVMMAAAPTQLAAGAALEQTLPKEWQMSGKLGVQVEKEVNYFPSERISIPVSVRNDHDQPLELHLTLAGIPPQWGVASPLEFMLNPHEVQLYYLVLQTLPTSESLLLTARLNDANQPQVNLSFQLKLLPKSAPNLSGRLEPALFHEKQPAYLYLQNHTQAAMQIFLAGYSPAPGIYVLPEYPVLELPAGQGTRVAVKVDVRQRSLLMQTQQAIQVSAKQGKRSALDFPAQVQIDATLPLTQMLLACALAACILMTIFAAAGVLILAR